MLMLSWMYWVDLREGGAFCRGRRRVCFLGGGRVGWADWERKMRSPFLSLVVRGAGGGMSGRGVAGEAME